MKFDLKVQQIPEKTDKFDTKHRIAVASQIDAPNTEASKHRGVAFLTIELYSKDNIDLLAPTYLFIEKLKHHYYHMDSSTPTHAIEKALDKAINTITHINIPSKTITKGIKPIASIDYNFCVAIIKERVLYISHFGECSAYLIKHNTVRNLISHQRNLDVWTTSSLIDADDVIVTGTKGFSNIFPAETILSNLGNIAQTSKEPNSTKFASILIKILDTRNNRHKTASNVASRVKKTLSTINTKISATITPYTFGKTLHDEFRYYQNKKSAPISSIQTTKTEHTESKSVGTKAIRAKLTKSRAKHSKIYKATFAMLIFASLIYINHRVFNFNQVTFNDVESINLIKNSAPSIKGLFSDTSQAPQTNNLFFDLASVAPDIMPTGLSMHKRNNLIIIDRHDGKVYKLNIDTKESHVILDNLDNPKHLTCELKYCFILDNHNIRVINPDEKNKQDKYPIEIAEVIDISAYGNNLYVLSPTDIYQFNLQSGKIKKWNKEPLLQTNYPISISADVNVFILGNKQIFKHLKGSLDTSYFSENNNHLDMPIKMLLDNINIYVLDTNQNFVFIYDKLTGKLKEEVPLPGVDASPTLFTLGSSSGQIYYIVDKQIYSTND